MLGIRDEKESLLDFADQFGKKVDLKVGQVEQLGPVVWHNG